MKDLQIKINLLIEKRAKALELRKFHAYSNYNDQIKEVRAELKALKN